MRCSILRRSAQSRCRRRTCDISSASRSKSRGLLSLSRITPPRRLICLPKDVRPSEVRPPVRALRLTPSRLDRPGADDKGRITRMWAVGDAPRSQSSGRRPLRLGRHSVDCRAGRRAVDAWRQVVDVIAAARFAISEVVRAGPTPLALGGECTLVGCRLIMSLPAAPVTMVIRTASLWATTPSLRQN